MSAPAHTVAGQAELFKLPASEPTLPLRDSGPDPSARGERVALALDRTPKRILVLGATSGIAEACCRLWASRGEYLYLVARTRGAA